jgi:hypothetical protein
MPHQPPPPPPPPQCGCCIVLSFGGLCDQTSCCCGTACNAAPAPPAGPVGVTCPINREPCNINASTWSASDCATTTTVAGLVQAGNSSCQGCTDEDVVGIRSVTTNIRCPYRNPANGFDGGNFSIQQSGSGLYQADFALAGGLTTCAPQYYGAGACRADGNNYPRAISCNKVAVVDGGGFLVGGQAQQCCTDTASNLLTAGSTSANPVCFGGSTISQVNLDITDHAVVNFRSCRPACRPGYTLKSGNETTTCDVNGVLHVAVCAPDSCSTALVSASTPMNGQIGNCNTALQHGQTCQHTCDPPYVLSGATRCIAGSVVAASCDRKCTLPAPPVNGSLGGCVTPLDPGQTCSPFCDPGFRLVPPLGHSCSDSSDARGIAILDLAACSPASCDVSMPPTYGSVGTCCTIAGCEIEPGSSCRPDCNPGYTVSGNTTCVNGQAVRATCIADACTVLPLDNGAMGNCPTVLPHGQSCIPTCNAGYELSVAPWAPQSAPAWASSYCSAGSLVSAVCAPLPCDASQPPAHGLVGSCTSVLKSGELCQPSCISPYQPDGPTSCFAGVLTAATCQPETCSGRLKEAEEKLKIEHEDVCFQNKIAASRAHCLLVAVQLRQCVPELLLISAAGVLFRQ